jgi:DNA polymerase-1
MTFTTGESIALAVADGIGAALVGDAGGTVLLDDTTPELFTTIAAIERDIGPRWVWWTADTARTLVDHGIRPARCWDLDAVHRLLVGGWRAGPARVWAAHRGLAPPPDTRRSPPDLFSPPDDGDPIRSDGHLDPTWIDGRWRTDLAHLERWASLAAEVHDRQIGQLAALTDRPAAAATARSESATALLCAELEHDGLPIDVIEAERIIATFIGPRPTNAAAELRITGNGTVPSCATSAEDRAPPTASTCATRPV